MSEKLFAREFVQLTKPLHPVRIENALLTPGLPDVSLSVGFCELKWLRSYPKRETTPVRIEHYTDDQRNWLMKRYRAGGGAWLCLKVRTDWYIFNALQAQRVGNVSKSELQSSADCYFSSRPSTETLCLAFKQSLESINHWQIREHS